METCHIGRILQRVKESSGKLGLTAVAILNRTHWEPMKHIDKSQCGIFVFAEMNDQSNHSAQHLAFCAFLRRSRPSFVATPCLLSSLFITPEGSKISHKNTKIHKITHTKYDVTC